MYDMFIVDIQLIRVAIVNHLPMLHQNKREKILP